MSHSKLISSVDCWIRNGNGRLIPILENYVVIVDRDGTLIHHHHHLKDPELVRLLPTASRSIRQLNSLGATVVMATNQSVIGNGIATAEEVRAVNLRIIELLRAEDAKVDGVFICPHREGDNCRCRKPETHGITHYLAKRGLAERSGVVIGDNVTDMVFANRLNFQGIHVATGVSSWQEVAASGAKAQSSLRMADAVEWIVASLT